MIRDEFKDLIEKKEALSNYNLSQDSREINKQIRESISSISEGVLAFVSIGDKNTLGYLRPVAECHQCRCSNR